MPLVTDADLAPTNTTYDMAFDGISTHAGVGTPAVGEKYITDDALFPNGSGGFLAKGVLALCTLTSPETWVALKTPKGMRIADSSTGIIWLRTPTEWNAIEARLDIMADPTDPDVSGALNQLILDAAAVSSSLPIYLSSTVQKGVFIWEGWKVQSQIVNAQINPIICQSPIYWMGSAISSSAIVVGDPGATQPIDYNSLIWSEYWVENGNTTVPDYTTTMTGIEFVNIQIGKMRVRAHGFWTGVQVHGHNTGSQLNHFDLFDLDINLKGVCWKGTGTAGYVNDNFFFFGYVAHDTTTAGSDSPCVLRLDFSAGAGGADGNKWYAGPLCELGAQGGMLNFIETIGSQTGNAIVGNEFHGMRIDVAASPLMDFLHLDGNFNVVGNLFNFAFNTQMPRFGGARAQAVTAASLNTFEIPFTDGGVSRYDAKQIVSIGRANVTGRMSGGNFFLQAPARGKLALTGSATFVNEGNANQGSLTASSIRLPVGAGLTMGVFLDTRNVSADFLRKVMYRVNLRGGLTSGGRFIVAGIRTTGAAAANANDFAFISDSPFVFGTFFWGTSSDITPSTSTAQIGFSATIAYLFLGVCGGTSQADFTSLEVFAPADSGITLVTDPLLLQKLGPSLPLIDDSLPYSLGVPYDPVVSTISALTPGSTTQITTAAANTYGVGDPVYFTGITGTGAVSALNGTVVNVATVSSSTVFTIAVNTTGGTYTSGGTTQVDLMPQGQVVRALQPSGTAGTPYQWIRNTGNTWSAVNF